MAVEEDEEEKEDEEEEEEIGVRGGRQRRRRPPLVLETLSLRPLVLSIQNFLDDGECEEIITTAEPLVRASEVKLMDKDKGKVGGWVGGWSE